MKIKNIKNIKNICYFLIFLLIFLYYVNMIYNIKIEMIILFSIIPIFTYFVLGSFLIGFILQWITFLNVNPYPLINDNKLSIMNTIPVEFRPSQQFRLDNCDLQNIQYPIIIKPITCSGCSNKVFIVENYEDAIQIINDNNIDPTTFMTQTFLEDYNLEVGILYEKNPWNNTGKIMEIIEKSNTENIRTYDVDHIVDRSIIINEHLEQRVF